MKNWFIFLSLLLALSSEAQNVPSYVPTNGLVGWWPFNGNANDESGNGFNGTVNGATLTTDRFGYPSRAYSFDGISNEIFVSHAASLNLLPISISAWFKTASTQGNLMIINKYGCATANGYSLHLDNGRPSAFYFSGNNAGFINLDAHPTSALNLNDNNWHLATVTIFSTGIIYYIDGVIIYNGVFYGSAGNTTNTLEDLHFGKYPMGICAGNLFFNGLIDDIGIWNRALSQQEITNLYNASLPATSCPTIPSNLQTGLVGYWPFCGNANDESGNGNSMTPMNNTILTSDRYGNINSAYYLDGADDYLTTNNPFYSSGSDHTLSIWFLSEDSSRSTQCLFNTNPHRIESVAYNSYLLPSPYGIGFCLGDAVNWNVVCGPSGGFYPNFNKALWNNLVIVKSGLNWNFYLNGTLAHMYQASTNTTGTLVDIMIGAISGGYNWPNEEFQGKLDDIAIWNRALTTSEISQLYTAQSTNQNNNTSTNSSSSTLPTGISYQAVARDSTGQPLANRNATVRFTLRDSSITGTAVYVETHAVTTNSLGLFTAVIGGGSATSGTYSAVNWMGPQKFLSVELDYGNGFQLIGSQQLLSVPYANAADKAARIKNGNLPVYSGNVAALAAGLQPGDCYRTPTGVFMIVY